MNTLCVILARAGSKGLPGKNVLPVAGRPMVGWTIEHALTAQCRGAINRVVFSTDGDQIAGVGREMGIDVVMRPAELADDTATVDAAARHAVLEIENQTSAIDNIVILYGNVPHRPDDLIDRAVAKLIETGCDSVQSVCPVGKHHPYWMKTLDGDRLLPYVENAVHRRQDLPAVYQLDGGIIAVTRASLFTVKPGQPHAFLGTDRRAVVTGPGEVVDVDEPPDLEITEAVFGAKTNRSIHEVRIGNREIGPVNNPVYVIAELGVNHDGSLERALDLTRLARQCDADAVKLQLFDPDMLLSDEAELAGYQQSAADNPHAMLKQLQLSVDQMLEVKALAHELGMGFIVTPFSLENFSQLRQIDPDAVKIASPDCVNRPLTELMKSLGKPMLISTGACDQQELREMLSVMGEHPAVYLHCVSAYPVPDDQAALGMLTHLADSCLRGYSDHTNRIEAGGLAVALGACVIEKHLTYDRNASGPDHAASCDPPGFSQYVKGIRLAQMMIGDKTMRQVLPVENDVRKVSRQSLCAVRDLQAGHVICREEITIKRPGTGIPAHQLDAVIGKTLKRDVKANHLLHSGDV